MIAKVQQAGPRDYDQVIQQRRGGIRAVAHDAGAQARRDRARDRRRAARATKPDLGALVTLEMGKILAEGQGEVQEMIDIADFAVGLSRQLYGLTMHSERPGHRMYEQWHPLGIVGVITAFNFPVAVWAWNAHDRGGLRRLRALEASSQTPLAAIAVQKICNRVLDRHGLKGVFNLVIGRSDAVGEALLDDRRIPLVSFTGSTAGGPPRRRNGGAAAWAAPFSNWAATTASS